VNDIESARAIGILNRQFQLYLNAALSGSDLTYSECIFLINIYSNEGINQEELSVLLAIDKAATARSIKSLESKGYITRKSSGENKKVKTLYIAEEGKQHKQSIKALFKKWDEFITEGMSKEEKEAASETVCRMADRASRLDLVAMKDSGKYRVVHAPKSASLEGSHGH